MPKSKIVWVQTLLGVKRKVKVTFEMSEPFRKYNIKLLTVVTQCIIKKGIVSK